MKRSVVLTVEDTNGTKEDYTISLPKAGQVIQIEELKISLSMHYRELAMKQSILSNLALDIVDMQAYFTVLCPQLLKDMKAPLLELDLVDILQLRKNYEQNFIPWWNEWVRLCQEIPAPPKVEPLDESEDEDDELPQSPKKKDKFDPNKTVDLG